MPNGCLKAMPRKVLKINEYPGGLAIHMILRKIKEMPNGCLKATPREVLKINEYLGGLAIPSDTQKENKTECHG